jgi:pSer/pThr/pTyr-binding forkhead associated (FHA) protein
MVEVEPAGGELRFGRRAGVEVALPFPVISGLHAHVFRHGGGWALADLGSANGTFVADRRLPPGTPHLLRVGETVRLADVSVTFEGEAGARPPDHAGAPTESTATIARRLVNDLFQAMSGAEVARLEVTGGPAAGRSLLLAVPDRIYKVGRAPECDLVLADDDVSREHAAFSRRWQGVFVRDLGSKNGIEVGGERMAGEARLHDGEILVLGGTELRVDDPEERYLRRMEDEREAAAAAPAIGGPPEEERPPEGVVPEDLAAPGADPVVEAGPRGRSPVPVVVTALAVLVLAGVVYVAYLFLRGMPTTGARG